MDSRLVLIGTPDEMKSPRALKIVASAVAASVALERREVPSESDVAEAVSPIAKSLGLCYGDDVKIGSTDAMMRTIASLSPGSKVGGESDVDKAMVEGWMSYVWSSLDLPMEALKTIADDNETKASVQAAFGTLECHLYYQTYMVGHAITLADISLVVSLQAAIDAKVWEPKDGTNLKRFYDTMINQSFFQSAVKAMKATSSTVGAPAAQAPSGSGLYLSGSPTPVVNKMYRRNRIRIKEILENDGAAFMEQVVTVGGWARTTRNANKGQLLFIELNDGSSGTSLQCVLDSETTEGFAACKASGGTGSSFQLVGKVIASPAKGQSVELQVTSGTLLGAVYGGNAEGTEVGGMLYPMSKKAHTLEFMRDVAHLRPRGRIHAAAMRIRHAMAYATHNFFHNHGFLYIHTPIITCADCEGAGEQFAVTTMLGNDPLETGLGLPLHEPVEEKQMSKKEMKRQKKKAAAGKDLNKPEDVKVVGAVDYGKDFFARRANLTVSGQLNVETHACALSDVYTFGPTFRAENSHTGRHLSEFWMIEPEIAFADLNVDINLAEDYLKYCVQFALDTCADDLEFFENNPHGEVGLRARLRNVLDNPFKRLTYTEAIEVLQKAVEEDGAQFEEKPVWGIDLPSEHERYLCEKVYKMPVVLTNYPKEIKAFYMKLNEDGKTVAAMDVLVPKIGEIIGGSQREHRKEVLVERCLESHIDPRQVWWYLDLRKYGTVPHAGFGLGFERLILFVTGLQNIRDVIPFPRWAGNAEF